MFHAEEHCASVLPSRGFPWAVNPDCLRFLPQKAYRHHRYLTSTTACWLISRCIIIGHSPLRACPPQTGCTPAFPLGSLDAIFFTAWLAERTSARLLQECHCAPVTAHETANVSELLDMAGRIWRDSILHSEPCIPLRHFSMYVLSACVVSTHET